MANGAERDAAFSEFLSFLEDRNILSSESVKRARNAHTSTDHAADIVLIELGLTREDDLARHLSSFLDLPLIERIPADIEPSLIKSVGMNFIESNQVLPLALSDDRIVIGVADPFAKAACDVLGYHLDRKPELRIFPRSAIAEQIRILKESGEVDLSRDLVMAGENGSWPVNALLKAGAVTVSIAGLVLVNLGVANHPIDTSPITAQQSADGLFGGAETGSHAEQAANLSEPSLVETFSRPLFAKNRRRWEPPPPSKPPPKPAAQPEKPVVRQTDPPDFNLIGISISDGAAKALVRRNSELEPVWVLEGEAVGGWVVSAIDNQSIVVRQQDQTVSIDLFPDISAGQ